MSIWRIGNRWGFNATTLLLLTSCSAPIPEGTDSNLESVEYDIVVDTFYEIMTRDAFDSGEMPADSYGDKHESDNMAVDGIQDTDALLQDTSSDVLSCGDVPKEGCPCDKFADEPCCLMEAKGLSCANDRLVNGVFEYQWGVFWDCGCIECEGYEIYPLCPWESRKEYF